MILEIASLCYGSTLAADVLIVGSYFEPTPSGKDIELPRYEVSRLLVYDKAIVAKNRKTSGVVRARFDGDALSKAGQAFEYTDTGTRLKEYTLGASEKLSLISLTPNGLPPSMSVQWDRLVRGPMSPTLEQEVYQTSGATASDGQTYTITNPDAGNLIILNHAYYWRVTTPDVPVAGASMTLRGYAGESNFDVLNAIFDKVASGSEGTTIACTNGGRSENCAGSFLEYSGMTATPFVAISGGEDSNAGDVTTVGTGLVNTTGTANTLLFSTFAHNGSPTSWTYAPTSFVEEGLIAGGGGGNVGIRVATRVVASASTYENDASWTTAVRAAGIVAAYAITVASPPVNTVTAGPLSAKSGIAKALTISVAEGSAPLVSTTVSVVSGKGVINMTASGSSIITGNGTNSAVVTNGSLTDKNNTLATATFTGTHGLHEPVPVTVLSSDGTLTDSDDITVYLDPHTLVCTFTGTYAQALAAFASLQFKLDAAPSGTVDITVTDPGALTDTQTITLFVPSASGSSGGELGQCRMFHYLGLGF